ncbi:hypothetical protein DRJ16_05295 [Candidatus Woesearchaeota archaeon]|nr:MAG: hypothetical protein DRJ16_05295 [Candidatus Woesearchaeota archaeon]
MKKEEFQIVEKDYVEQKKNKNKEVIESCCNAWKRHTIKQGYKPIFCPTCQTDIKTKEKHNDRS